MPSLRPLLNLSLTLLITLPALAQSAAPKPGSQTPQLLEKQIPIRLNYLLYLPENYSESSGDKYPLILFLHGSGERGDDVNKVKVHGPPKLIDKGQKLPFIVVSPQCPATTGGWRALDLITLLDDVSSKYKVDPDRVYLTGLSMGGFGTWELASQYPNRFAAIAPICGGGNPSRVRQMRTLPIWVFHGEADPTVPVKNSLDMVEALKAAGATDVKLTTYPGVGHDSWTRTYNNPELFEWFLKHKLSDRPAAPARR
jgi:predicted peptidase